jgi:hypothetical protein
MTHHRSRHLVSCRTAIAGIGAEGLGLAIAITSRHASAQNSGSAMASRPIVGAWMVTASIGPSQAIFSADGTKN